jgi:peptidoglycan hydrolase-like protein with peptidoglycan-binding domain
LSKRQRYLFPLLLASLLTAGTAHATSVEGGVGSTAGTEATITTVVATVSAPSHTTLVFDATPNAPIGFWEQLAQCETASDWNNTGQWAGGLGIYTKGNFPDSSMGTWERFGGEEFALSPDKATKEQQVIVANRISVEGWKTTVTRDADKAKRMGVPQVYEWNQKPVGFGGWGCYKSKSTGKYRMSKPLLLHYDPQLLPIVQYEWNQKGIVVEDLQKLIGVTPDGHYGTKTRQAHIRYLKTNKMSTLGVGKLPDYLTGSYPQDKAKRCPEWEGRLRYYGLLPVDRFSYIMWRESRCQEKIVSKPNRNGTRDYGLLQINSSWSSVTKKLCKTNIISALTNHKCNLTVAKYLFDNGGLNHWAGNSGYSK